MTALPIVVLDFETTGLSEEEGDRVVEVGLVRLGGDLRIEREYSTLVNPQRPMGASFVHGIREADVLGAPTFADIAGDVGDFMEGAILAGHNVYFDLGFLLAEFRHAGISMPPGAAPPVIDTLELARDFLQGMPNHKLPTVCEACGIPAWDHHGALGDAMATAQFLAYLARLDGAIVEDALRHAASPLHRGWTGRPASGRTVPRKTLASLAGAGGQAAVPTSKPPPLEGEVAVFTGGVSISRDESIRVAEMLGCKVRSSVTGKTSIVVVGDPDVGRLWGVGSGKSQKHREAEERAAAGQRLRVLSEADFMRLAEVVSDRVITDEEWVAVRELVYSAGHAPPDESPRKVRRRPPPRADDGKSEPS